MASGRAPVTIAVACATVVAAAAPASAQVKRLDKGRAVHAAGAKPVAPAIVLRRLERALTAGPADRRRDVSPLLRRLATALPSLHGSQRRRAARLLARPSDGASDPQGSGWTAPEASGSPRCSAHFCVHWVASGADAPPLADANKNGVPDWIETVSATAEHVYAVENGTLGWRAPKSDGTKGGGSNLTDIYLADVGGSSIFGYAAPDPQPASNSVFGYLVLDNDFSPSQFPGYANAVDPLDVTLAHEYDHVLQFGYDILEQTWFLESTAVWMEGKVYEPLFDYLQYVPGWTQLTAQPLTQFDSDPSSRNNVKVYGSAVWNKWLDARYGQEVVRAAWEGSVGAGSFAPGAYEVSIRSHGGEGFSDEFGKFAAATAEWQAPNSGFPDGRLYPDVDRVGDLPIDGGPGTISLDHTAFALVNVPVTGDRQIRLATASPKGTAAALALVGLVSGAQGPTLVEAERSLPNGGHGAVTFNNPGGLQRLTAVLVNSDAQHGSFSQTLGDFLFTRDGQPFYADASTDFEAPRVGRLSPRNGAHVGARHRVKVRFSERVLGVTKHRFSLIAPSGKRVSAKLRFKQGSKHATLVPRRRLHHGRTYRVKVTSGVTDLALNRLKTKTSRFRVR